MIAAGHRIAYLHAHRMPFVIFVRIVLRVLNVRYASFVK